MGKYFKYCKFPLLMVDPTDCQKRPKFVELYYYLII
jgi:hypothetical protein